MRRICKGGTMIYPKYHKIYSPLWGAYFRFIIQKEFHGFYFDNSFPIKKDKGLLVVANHFSWWDGFFLYKLNEMLFKKRFHVMMLEENLEKNKFLRYSGAYSVARNSRSLIESLNFTHRLLENPDNMVLIFPQGEIKSAFQQHFQVEKGAFRVAQKNPDIQVINVAMFTDYFEQKKPGVYLYLNEIKREYFSSFGVFKEAFVKFQMESAFKHGERKKSGIN